jgi:hypothetical protein
VPAVFVAFSLSPRTVMLTALVFLVSQRREGNVLTPRIQGQTIKGPSVYVFLAVKLLGGHRDERHQGDFTPCLFFLDYGNLLCKGVGTSFH